MSDLRRGSFTAEELAGLRNMADWGGRVAADLRADPVGRKALEMALESFNAELADHLGGSPKSTVMLLICLLRIEMAADLMIANIEKKERRDGSA